MPYNAYRWGPGETPGVIRRLIFATCFISLLAALTNGIFVHLLQAKGPFDFLTLSWNGMVHYYLWQPVTYLFVQESIHGVHLYFLVALFLNMYALWILGSTLQERIGTRQFLYLYFFSGILAGLTALLVMPLTGQYMNLSGPTAAILAVFVLWTMYNPDSELLLFFLLPIKTKWLLAGILGMTFLISLSQWDLVNFTFYLFGALYGYLFGLIFCRLKSPFEVTHHIDEAIINALNRWPRKTTKSKDSKIVDFSTFQASPLDDDDFVDAMLTKIAKFGEQSLTAKERKRMESISRSKRGE